MQVLAAWSRRHADGMAERWVVPEGRRLNGVNGSPGYDPQWTMPDRWSSPRRQSKL